MSVVAVKITKEEIKIACDKQTTLGNWMKYDGSQNEQGLSKIEKFDDIIIGSVGYAATLQMMSLFLETNKLKDSSEREIVRFFKEFDQWLQKETDKSVSIRGNAFILIADKKVFQFSNYYVRQIYDYWSIGSGAIWALPSLELGASVKKAVEVACKYDLYCSGEPKVLTVKL